MHARRSRNDAFNAQVPDVKRRISLAVASILIFSPSTVPGAATIFKGKVLVLVTVLLTAWTLLRLCLRRHRYEQLDGKSVRLYSLFLALIALLLFVRLPGSPSEEYGWSKTLEYATKVLVPTLFLLSFGSMDSRDIGAMLLGLVFSSLITTIPILSGVNPYTITASQRLDTIDIGRLLGSGIVAVIAWSSIPIERSRRRFVLLTGLASVAVVMLVVGLVACGQRGPLIGVVSSLLVLALWPSLDSRQRRGHRIAILVITIVVGCTIVLLHNPKLFATGEIGTTRLRRAFMTIGQEDDAGRWDKLQQGIAAYARHPWIGVGTGGYLSFFQQNSNYVAGAIEYPHNLLVEFAAEEGLLGVLAIAITLYFPLARIGRMRRHLGIFQGGAVCASLFFFWLVNSMVSGDVTNNSAVFVWGLLVMIYSGTACSASAAASRSLELTQLPGKLYRNRQTAESKSAGKSKRSRIGVTRFRAASVATGVRQHWQIER